MQVMLYAALVALAGPRRAQGAPLAILGWVASNLGVAAVHTRAWYAEHFPSYGKRVSAIVPGLL